MRVDFGPRSYFSTFFTFITLHKMIQFGQGVRLRLENDVLIDVFHICPNYVHVYVKVFSTFIQSVM